jgi:hypothetical protein
LTASVKDLPCAGCVDDVCVANLVQGWCYPVAAAAIMADLEWAAVDATAVLAGGGKGRGGTTTGGGGGGIEGRRIVLVIIDININVKFLTSKSMAMAMAAGLKAAESRTAIGGAGRQRGCSCQGERVAESVLIRGRVI